MEGDFKVDHQAKWSCLIKSTILILLLRKRKIISLCCYFPKWIILIKGGATMNFHPTNATNSLGSWSYEMSLPVTERRAGRISADSDSPLQKVFTPAILIQGKVDHLCWRSPRLLGGHSSPWLCWPGAHVLRARAMLPGRNALDHTSSGVSTPCMLLDAHNLHFAVWRGDVNLFIKRCAANRRFVTC